MAENVAALVFVVMPLLIAGGAALVTAVVMQARTEAALARQREALAEAKALLATQHRAMEERVRATEENARRRALDEFMADIRIEERQYLREVKSMLAERQRLVIQERLCFRNIPLTGWVDRTLPAGVVAAIPAPAAERHSEPVVAAIEVRPHRLLR